MKIRYVLGLLAFVMCGVDLPAAEPDDGLIESFECYESLGPPPKGYERCEIFARLPVGAGPQAWPLEVECVLVLEYEYTSKSLGELERQDEPTIQRMELPRRALAAAERVELYFEHRFELWREVVTAVRLDHWAFDILPALKGGDSYCGSCGNSG